MSAPALASDLTRLATIKALGRALPGAGTDIEHILEQLAVALTASISDGCAISWLPASGAAIVVTRHHNALATDPRVSATIPFPSRGTVTITRDGSSAPFDNEDLDTALACIEYTNLAIESAERRARSVQFQKQILGTVGHDLRGPLAAILIGTELLETAVAADATIPPVVKRIGTSATRMCRMVDQLLDMTRAGLGEGIPVERSKMNLLPLITSVIDVLSMTHPAASFELIAGAGVTGSWDRERLAQAISSLLRNATQYGLEGAPILIDVASADGAATIAVHNTVRDEPIPPESLATLFEPYRRGAREVRHTTSGLGVGLYIAHEIVRAHGGSISVASADSRTTFRIVLPLE